MTKTKTKIFSQDQGRSVTSVCTELSDLCMSAGCQGANDASFSAAIGSNDRLGSSVAGAGEPPSCSLPSARGDRQTPSPPLPPRRKLFTRPWSKPRPEAPLSTYSNTQPWSRNNNTDKMINIINCQHENVKKRTNAQLETIHKYKST